jgi:CheY-like chemotaxis protein
MAEILYAEDEFTNRRLIQIHLQRANISCDLASDGEEAWEMFSNHDYRLIILDQYMPGMNGDELARKIKSVKPDLPLIAITSDDTEVTTLKNAGFSEVFIKPLRGRDYIDTILQYLNP